MKQGSYYHILNSQYAKVDQKPYNQRNLSFSNDIVVQHSNINHSHVYIQVVPSATMQDLPSRPIRVDISGQYNNIRGIDTLYQRLIIVSSSWSDTPSHKLFHKSWKCHIYRKYTRR
jgi:hypothetical protein